MAVLAGMNNDNGGVRHRKHRRKRDRSGAVLEGLQVPATFLSLLKSPVILLFLPFVSASNRTAGGVAAKLKEADSNAHPGLRSSRIGWRTVPKSEHTTTR